MSLCQHCVIYNKDMISGCIFTKSDIVKHRIAVVNNMFLERCKELSFTFIDNSNIKSNALKDFVHLNYVGERMFRENLKGFWKN